ncbi:MAG TPA: diguanylate cyclase [Spirochaetota bacterium]|nr:diguanylate cyclase [Spirochaetota bacterium]HPQ52657.1 diguanylate cyclase [Spirochaetota bacterium]
MTMLILLSFLAFCIYIYIIVYACRQNHDTLPEGTADSSTPGSEDTFKTLIFNSTDIFSILDTSGTITFMSPASRQSLGYNPEEMKGKKAEAFCHPEDIENHRKVFNDILHTQGQAASRKLRICHRDGSWKVFEIIFRNMINTPSIQGIAVNLHDITEKKIFEEELRTLRENLERKVIERTEALAGSNSKLIREIDERRDIEHKLRSHSRYLAALHETTLSIMNRLDLMDLLQSIIENASMLVNAPHGYICIVENDQDVMTTRFGVGAFRQRIGDQLTKKDGVAGKVWSTGEPFSVNDYGTYSGRTRHVDLESLGPLISVPLKGGDTVLGVIGLARDRGDTFFMTEDTTLLVQFSELASIAVDNSRLYSNAQAEIIERKHVEESLWEINERYRTILESIQDGYFENDLSGNMTFFNAATLKIFGYESSELLGLNYHSYMDKENAAIVFKAFNEVYTTGIPIKAVDWELTKKDGSKIYVEASINLIRDIDGNPVGFRGIVRDITDRKALENSLKYLAHHDILTKLPNRTLFTDRLEQALAMAKRNFYLVAVMFLDLDNFKEINDDMGHDAGDMLLVEVAKRLIDKVRVIDTVSRFGGDEFIIILPEIKSIDDARRIVTRVFNAFSRPFDILGVSVTVTSSIGIAFYPIDGQDGDTVLKLADKALYQCKEKGRNCFNFYSVTMNRK